MTFKKTTTGPLRYRAYFWLLDASMLGIVVFIASVIYLSLTGVQAFGLPPLASTIIGAILLVLLLVVPFVLVVVKPMRDEYAETLWRRAVAVLGYAATVIPVLFWITLYATYDVFNVNRLLILQEEDTPAFLTWSPQKVSVGEAILTFYVFYTQLFILTCQFLRWRDSR